MAKQRGIHQISGKINNLCYYEQKYVRGGLIRRINEAMSERLKTDPVFANTRRANTIFGGCSIVSSVLLEFFGSRNTFLFKPYRHALLTREVQRYLITVDEYKGYPTIIDRTIGYNRLPQIISKIVKNSIFNDFLELNHMLGNVQRNDSIDFVFNFDSLVAYCKKYKCIGVQLTVSRAHYIYGTAYETESGAYVRPEYNAGGRVSFVNWYLDEADDDATLTTQSGDVDDALTFFVLYATPILSTRLGRPILGETGASCGVVTFLAE